MSENWLYLLPEGVAAADARWPVWLRAADGSLHKARLEELAPTLTGPAIVVVPMGCWAVARSVLCRASGPSLKH